MHSRRALHESFFPFPSSSFASPSPSLPPSQPPTLSFPKYPSSTTTNSPPFFPVYPSPPPPPPSPTLATFPANISSLILPSSNHSPSHHFNLLLPLLLPLLAVALLSLSLVLFLLLRRRRLQDQLHCPEDPRSDSLRLFPPNSTTSDGRKLSTSATTPATGSDFLYLGTLVNSRGRADESSSAAPAAGSPYRKLGSPELRPLPPLAPQVRHSTKDGSGSSDEEFYSPKGSPVEKESSAVRVSSSRSFGGPALEKCGYRSSTLSSRSYPSSRTASSPSPSSSPPVGSSPGRSTDKSVNGSSVVDNTGFQPPPPPLPPRLPPPPPRRQLIPSPPKRKPPSPSPEKIDEFERNTVGVGPPHRAPPPPPPPPPPVGHGENQVSKSAVSQPVVTPRPAAVHRAGSPESLDAAAKSDDHQRPKLKTLHWDKVRASSDRAMVWDRLKSSSFQLNEEMIETLFVCNATNTTTGEAAGRLGFHSLNQENRVLDPKKSQNIAILLRALNVTKEEVCEALLEGNPDSLGNELLETLLKMAPSKEEELKLREYKDDSPFKLGPAENFLKAVLDVPFAFKRVDAMLYIANFDSEVSYLRKSFETLEAACGELRSSRLFLKLLEAVLKTGNRMNVGTNRGDAQAFKLDTLLKLVDIKGTDGKTTLLHFVVQEIIRAEGSRLSVANTLTTATQTNTLQDDLECKKLGLQVVSELSVELSNVKKAATMDSDVLNSYVLKLAGGIEKITEALRLNNAMGSRESSLQFHLAMNGFLKRADEEIIKVQAQENVALSLVKEITEYFHGNSAKEEAHPFRIFMVVRDFLSILDQVCKEVGRIHEHTIFSSARQFTLPVNPMLQPAFPRLNAFRPGSSDDESSSSSSSSSS